jgi:hypothetical protein
VRIAPTDPFDETFAKAAAAKPRPDTSNHTGNFEKTNGTPRREIVYHRSNRGDGAHKPVCTNGQKWGCG